MEKEASWVHSKCVVFVLVELAKKPITPMRLRALTKIPGNYANIILKKLEFAEFVKCLTPHEKIGKVFCINPERKSRVEKIFRERGIAQEIIPLPDLNWRAYGILLCRNLCVQICKVFKKAYELGNEADFENNRRRITIPVLQREKLPRIATSDIHRAFGKLVKLGLLTLRNTWPREYVLTEDALKLIEFDNSIIE